MLGVGVWDFFGIWELVVGISHPPSLDGLPPEWVDQAGGAFTRMGFESTQTMSFLIASTR